VINQHQKVLESCFVGVPDEKWGEKVVAAVVTTPAESVTVQEIKDHCRQQLLAWKCPKEVFFLKELPRNKMGKVMKEIVTKFFFSLSVPPSAKA
jgi:acyl-coenzyme A synthetase/AMP-(fatty) acid ligase